MHKKIEMNFWKFIEKTSFKQLFAFWILLIILFGGFYFLMFDQPEHALVNTVGLKLNAAGFYDAVYFSFITATATGYGDIVPLGFSKFLALIEVIVGMLIFGLLISKLVCLACMF